MKKTIAALLLSAAVCFAAGACDICGGASHLNPYLFPHLSRSYASLAYLRNCYHSAVDGSVTKMISSSLLLSGQYTVNRRLQLQAFVPYHFNHSEVGLSEVNTRGPGDVTLLAAYNALRFKTAAVSHVVSIGAGIKLPTGHYNADKSSELNNQNLQLGTGSLDYLANAAYRVSTGNFTLNAIGAYKYTTPNNSGYRFGDVLTTGATLIYTFKQKGFSLLPYVQVMNETRYRDAEHHILQNHSGGEVLYTGGGLDVSTPRLTTGVNYQAAAKQNLMRGELTAKPKFSARISFTL